MLRQLLTGEGVIQLYPGLFYFLQFGALACLHPFLSLMLADRSLTELQIGVVVAIIPLVKFLGSPLGGYIFDKSGESKIIWILVVIGTALSIQFLLLTSNLYLIGLICGIWSLIQSPMNSIANHAVLIHLGENKKNYGKYRLWGAVSWGIISFLIGVIITYFPLYTSYISYAIGLFIFAFYIFITKFKKITTTEEINKNEDEKGLIEDEESEIGNLKSNSIDHNEINHENDENVKNDIDVSSNSEENELDNDQTSSFIQKDESLDATNEEEENKSNFMILLHILLQRDVIVFFLVMFMMGIGVTVIYIYLFIYLQNDLNASETLMGISIVCTVSTEIPFFFYSGTFLDLFGEQWLILAALLAYVIRVIGYSFLQNPWFVLPLELLHGLTFGALYAAGVHYSSNLFPPHLSATGQGIFYGIYSGLGPTCGSILGGYLYYTYGARFMYRVMAGFVSIAVLIHVLNFHKELYTKVKLLVIEVNRRIKERNSKSLDYELEFDGIELDSVEVDEKIEEMEK